jgi:hypothetical protein
MTDQRLARHIGRLLAQASRGPEHHGDATVVAAGLAAGGGLVVTGDLDDLQALDVHAPGVDIEPLSL